MKKQWTAAVVGTGFIGPIHVEALRRCGVQVSGILGSSPEKSQRSAAQLGIRRGYASLDELLTDDDVDAVHITSPNQFHFEQASAALRAGKHVLCEKPLAMNSSQTAQLVQLANQTNRWAAVAYNIRFYPLCHEAAARVASNEFGSPTHITGSYVQDWLLHDTDFNWRVSAEEGGELRAVADIGTHWLDLAQFVSGQKVVAVCADLQVVHPQRYAQERETYSRDALAADRSQPIAVKTEDAAYVLLRFSDGARGSLHVSQTTAGRKNCLRFEIAGTKQSLAFNSERPNELWIGHRDRPNELLIRNPAIMSSSAASQCHYPGGHNEGFPDTFKQLIASFYQCLDSGRSPRDGTEVMPSLPTFADGHREVLLCEAILRSHQQQAWVDLVDTNEKSSDPSSKHDSA